MSRRHRAEKRQVIPDAKYGDEVLSKFMNSLMLHGKKSTAERILYGALDNIEGKLSREPVAVFHEALISAARGRGENTMVDRLAGELMDALNNRGSAVKKREDTHRMAEANRAFSHYRW